MSSCIVFQQNKKCYIASDGAVSVNFSGKNIRIKNDHKKIFIYEDSLIFCSGKMNIVEKIITEIKSIKSINPTSIQKICKSNYIGEDNLELFLVKYTEKVESYQLSSYNHFEIIDRVVDVDKTEILSLGYNSKSNLNKVFEHIGKHNSVERLIENIYKDISCPEVGGVINLYEISDEGILNISNLDIKDNYCILDKLDSCDKNLLVGETIVGKIIAGHNLLIGNENNTMIIDENAITIEGNCLSIKGVDGTNRDFNSYITLLSNQISLGVSDSKKHTDAQFKILSDRITSTVKDSSNADAALQSQITQTATDITAKVSKGTEFKTEFKQTSEAFDFTVGNNGTNVKIDKNGQTIRNGGLTVSNSNGTVVIDGSSNMFKIVSTVEIQLSAGTQVEYVYRIRHGMGYVPAYLAYQVGTYSIAGQSTNTLLPALTVFGAGSGTALSFTGIIRANADENDIIITYYRANTSLINNPRIKVFVLKEALL